MRKPLDRNIFGDTCRSQVGKKDDVYLVKSILKRTKKNTVGIIVKGPPPFVPSGARFFLAKLGYMVGLGPK